MEAVKFLNQVKYAKGKSLKLIYKRNNKKAEHKTI